MADARAAQRFEGCMPKLRAGNARVTDAARTADTKRATLGVAAASTDVANPWATSCAKSLHRAMAPPLNTGRVVPRNLAPLRAPSPENVVSAL
jgi:hypothetical protein